MKKELGLLFIFLLFSFVVLVSLSNAGAVDLIGQIDDLKSKFDEGSAKINNAIADPEAIRDSYLSRAWGDLITKNRIIGPFHTFFAEHQLPFMILFNEPYNISLTFILIVIVWVLFFLGFANFLRFWVPKKWAALLFSFGAVIIFSQISIFKLLITFIINIISSSSSWWLRDLFWIAFFAFLVFWGFINHGIGKAADVAQGNDKEEKLNLAVKKSEALQKGLEEGQRFRDKLNIGDKEFRIGNIGTRRKY